jgi:CrcB protein
LWLVAAGGALGAVARYAVARGWSAGPEYFPWATLLVNLSGCFVLGALLTWLVRRHPPDHWLRFVSCVGVLGAFTTFSTFAVETDRLLSHGAVGTALAYVLASVLGGVALCWSGQRVVTARPARRPS